MEHTMAQIKNISEVTEPLKEQILKGDVYNIDEMKDLEERDNALTCMYSPARLNDILGTASVIQDKLFKLQLLLNRA